MQKMRNKACRFAVGVALAAVLLLVWMNAAVSGILGDNPASIMDFGVLAPIVLANLAEEDDYGYAILQRVQEF